MAIVLRNVQPGFPQIAQAINGARLPSVGAFFHLDASEVTVTATTPTDLPSSLTLLNQAIGVFRFHAADTVAHKVADSVNLAAAPAVGAATTLANALTTYTSLKTAYNAHLALTTVNYAADSTNTWVATAPTDLPSLITALTEVKTKLNAHMASAPAGSALRVISA